MPRHLIEKAGTIEPQVAPAGVRKRLDEGVFFWLDIEQPQEEEFALLRDTLHLHPLALEDALHFGQRPKIDDYEDFAPSSSTAPRRGQRRTQASCGCWRCTATTRGATS